ncbi:hypothetical protein [Streptomyces sp. NPDC051014]|uniref:hypothetical protein n=1 Tax=Streptomyces sp. NPDC051014 TaxID=3155751 RepID=UPI0033DC6DA6
MTLTEAAETTFASAEGSFYSNLRSSAAIAALYAGTLAIPVPYECWTGLSTGAATARYEGIFLVFEPSPMRIAALTRCGHGSWHTSRVLFSRDLTEVARSAQDCTDHSPQVRRAQKFFDGLVRRKASVEDTQEMPVICLGGGTAAEADTGEEPGEEAAEK